MSTNTPPIPLTQAPLFLRALPGLGLEGRFETLMADGREVGQTLVVTRKLPVLGRLHASLRGPVWTADIPPEPRLDALKGIRGAPPRLIEADAPDPVLRRAGYHMVMTPGATGWLDTQTTADAAELPLAHPKWRANLARAKSSDLAIESGPFRGERADWLVTREAAVRKARRYRSAAGALARVLADCAPDALCLLTARAGTKSSEIIAAMLFARHGQSATYLMGATSEKGRAVCAHHLILARGCGILGRDGVRWLDLGQIDTLANPGLARFKLGTGARLHLLGGSWLRLTPGVRPLFTGKAGSPMVEALKR